MTKNYINICLIILVSCVLLFAWANRWNISKYTLSSDQEVYVKENIYTGVRCTLREGLVASDGDRIRSAFKFPNWCIKLEYPWNR